MGFDHFMRVGPVERGHAVGRIGDRIEGGPGEFAGRFGGGEGLIELAFGGGAAGEAFGETGPFLKKFGGAVVGPIGSIAEGHGVGRFKRFDDTDEMSFGIRGATGTFAGPQFGFHGIIEKSEVQFG